MQQLRGQSDPVAQDVLEIYYLCLTMGFKGRYVDLQGMNTLRTTIAEVGQELLRSKDLRLSPEFAARAGAASVLKEFPAWIIFVICLALVLALWMSYGYYAGSGWGAVGDAAGQAIEARDK